MRYRVFVCWEEVVYSDLNFLTPTLFTLSIEVLVTSQKYHVFVCLEGKGGLVILSLLPLHFLHLFI